MSLQFLVAFALFVGSVLAVPVAEEPKVPSENVDLKMNTNFNKLRQDGDDGEEVANGLELVAGPVAEIIQGTLTGNIGQLFQGVTGTVTDQEAQPGVGAILKGVSLPLQALWTSGIQAGQKYFNISQTTPPPKVVLAGPGGQKLTPGQPGQINSGAANQQVAPQVITLDQLQPHQLQQLLPQVQPQVVQQAAPATAAPEEVKTTTEEDDEDESESEAKRF